MTAYAGRDAKVYINGFDITAAFNNAKSSLEQGVYDSTTFGRNSRTFIGGLANGTIDLDGFYEAGTGTVDAVLSAAMAAQADGVALLFPLGDALGARGRGCGSILTKYEKTSPVDGIVAVAASIQSDGGLDPVVCLHPLGAETTTGDGASVDNGASTANGGVGYIEATAFTGTSVVVKIQHSADDMTFADLVTFAAISAANAKQRVAVAAGTTVNRYLRPSHASGTFSSVTDVVAFARN